MVFSMDAREDEHYDKVGSSFKRLPAGRYHVEVIDVDESFQKNADKLFVTFEVLAGTIPDHVGERHTEFFSVTEQAMDRLKRLAMVCGLIKPGEAKDISFEDCIHASLIIEFVPNSYVSEKTGKKVETTQLAFGGFWTEDHDDVKEVPRGKRSPQPTADQSADQPAATEAEAGSGTSQWDNI